MRVAMCAAVLVLTTSFLAAQEKAAVREIETDGIFNVATGAPTSKAPEPRVFASTKEIAMNMVFTKGAAKALMKQVDFEKERVVLFFWDWAGGDKIVPVAGKPGTFTYSFTGVGKGGFGSKIFVVPKGAEVKVVQEK